MTNDGTTTELSPVDLEPTVEYRALSAAAVLSLILGVASPLALLARTLWAVPILGVAAAALGLYRIRASEGALVGRNLALSGLGLSLLFGTCAASAAYTHELLLAREARKFGQLWLEHLISGNTYLAHQLGEPHALRPPLDSSLPNHYRSDMEAQRAFENFMRQPTIRTLLGVGKAGKVRFHDTQAFYREGEADMVRQAFAIQRGERQGGDELIVRIVLERRPDMSGISRWRVLSYGLDEPEA